MNDRGTTKTEPLIRCVGLGKIYRDSANGEVRRNQIIRSLVERNIYTGGPVAGNLLTLEMQRTKIAGEIDED